MAKKKKKFDLHSAINDIWNEYDSGATAKDADSQIDDIWAEYDRLPRRKVIAGRQDIPGNANPETKRLFASLLDDDVNPQTDEPVKPDFFKGVGILGQMLGQIEKNAVASVPTVKFDKNKKPNLSEGIGILGQMAGNIGKNVVSGVRETAQAARSLAAGTEPGVHGLFLSANKILETPRNLAYPYVGKTGQDILNVIYGPSGRLGSDIAQENTNQAREEFLKQPGVDNIDKSLYSIGEAVVPIAAAAATGPAAMKTFFASAAGQYAKEAENEGANPLQQAAYGAVMGAVEWLTEKIPFEKMMDALGGKGGLKALLSGMNAEGLQEVVTNPVQVLAKRLMYGGGQNESLFDIGRELQSYTLGAGTFGVIRGAGAVGVGTAKVGTELGKGIDKVAQGLRSIGVSEEQIQGMVEEAIVNQPRRFRPTTPLPAPVNQNAIAPEEVQPEAGSELINLLNDSGIPNSPSVVENVTREQPFVIKDGQPVVEEPEGLVGQNMPQIEQLKEPDLDPRFQGKSYEELQNMIDELENRLIQKYGEEAVVNAPISTNSYEKMGLPIPESPIAPEELNLFRSLYDAREKIDQNEIKQEINGVMSKLPKWTKDQASSGTVRSLLSKLQKGHRIEELFGENKITSTQELARDVYNGLMDEMVSKGEYPEDFRGDFDLALKVAGDFKNSIYGKSPRPVLEQTRDIVKVLTGQNIDIGPTMKMVKPEHKPPKQPAEPTFKYISEFGKNVQNGEATAQEIKDHHQFMVDNEDEIKASILDFINKDDRYKRKRKDTKAEMVDQTFDRELQRLAYAATDTFSAEVDFNDFKGARRRSIKNVVDFLTDEAIQKYHEARRQEEAATEKALTHPETLDEYRRFVATKGEAALTPEQRAKYDELISESTKDRKKKEEEKKSTVSRVDVNVGMDIVETKHTKTGEPLFAVRTAERVDADTFKTLVNAAKKLGGYYSSYRRDGAVPGFQFKTREAAEKFQALREGNVSTADVKAEQKVEAKSKTAQKLRDMAGRMAEAANESLNQDRQTNTAKRAREAAGAEESARADLAMAETLRNLADAIESGEAKHLDGITARTHVELLNQILRVSRNDAVNRLKDSSYEAREVERNRPYKPSDVDLVEYPYPAAWDNVLRNFVNDLENKDAKMYAARLKRKMVRRDERIEFKTGNDLELLRGAMAKAKALGISPPSYLESSLENYNRLQVMGLETLPQLRAALREYIQYKGKKAEADPIKKMERELAGKKFEGYFPTPKSIVDQMIREAGIEPGMTVLEPSAGKGNIADAIREAGVDPDVIEINSTLRNILQAKGHNIVGDDFTEHTGEYDRIIMNPPFENGQDIDHVRRAYDMLRPGGRLVAIMSEGPFYRGDKKAAAFREWLDEVDGEAEKLPAGSFKNSERSTDVNTRMVVIRKAVESPNIKEAEANDSLYNRMIDLREELITEESQRISDELQGVELVPSPDGSGRMLRKSKNPKWYREFYKEHKRRPNKSEVRQMAIDRLTNGFVSDEAGSTPPNDEFLEAQRMLEQLDRYKKTSRYADTGGYSDIEPEQNKAKEIVNKEIDEAFGDKYAVSVPGLAKTNKKSVRYKKASRREVNDIKKLLGIDVTGYDHRIDASGLRHSILDHGDAAREALQGQLPITVDDLKRIPDIIANYDFMKLDDDPNKKYEQPGVIYVQKAEDGTYFFLEVIGTKKHCLLAKSMWKRKATPHRVNAVTKSNPDTFNAQDAVRMKPSVDDIIAQSEEKVNSSKEHSDTGGYADVEPEYTKEEQSAKGQPKDKDVNSLAVEMPELLDLVRQINEGKLPLLKEKLGNALGKFTFRGEKGDIKLRRDIFIGERLGELTINPRKPFKAQVDAFKQGIFDQFGQEDIVFKQYGNKFVAYHRNPNLAIKVMAHEIGHLIDWLDEKTMSRGNLLGHLAAFKSYMKHVLPERPGAPGELTEADRRRLRAEAAKLAAKEKQAEAEPQEPGMPTAEDIKGIWNDVAAKEKYPALYEYIAHLDGGQKAQVLKEAMKGMVNLPGFDPSKRVNFKDWTAREKELYKKLIREELEKRRLFDLETITNELKNLTQIWKPFDDRRDPKYTRYRYSPEELYADAFSVLVNNPSLLKKTAPAFHRAFFNYLEARPNVKAVWDDIQNRIGDKAELLQQRLDKTYRNFTEGHASRRELNLRRKGTIKSVTDTLAAGLMDKNQGTLKYVRKYEKKGEYQAHLAERTRRELEETNYISAEAENYVYELGQKILKPLQEGNLTVDDLGVYMFHQRVIHERSDMANPEGYGEKTSKDELAALRIRLGETGYAKIEELAGEYRKLRETLIIPRVAQSRMFSKETVDMMMSRKHYARFSVQHYLDKTYGTGTTARIFKQVGTFSKIENPLVVTVLNDISMLRAAKINESKLATVAFLKEVNNDATAELLPGKNGELIPAGETNIIVPANTKFDGHLKKYVAAEPKDPRQALLQVMVDGEIHSFYVSKEIAKSYEYTPFEATRTMQVIGMVFGPLKSVLVSKNPLWMVRNVIRDLRTTYKNVPELKLRKNFGSFLKFYGQAYQEARKAVLKGERSDDLNEMYKNFMINPDRYYGAREKHSENDLERLTNEFKLDIYDEKEVETARNKLNAFFKAIPEWLEKRGRISEMTGKLAGYKFLKNKTDRSAADIAHMVRTRIGTPDVRRVGEWQQVTNSFFMFSNVNKEGVRAAVESYKEDPGAYVWKTVGTNIIPKAIMLAIGAGIMRHLGDDDDEWKRWADAIPDYDKRAYTILPIFGPRMTKDGKAVYFRMPEDYEGQMFGAIAHAIFKGKIFGQEGAVATALEQSPYEFPNSNPYVTVGYDLMAYFIWKQNPVDEYRGQNILPQKVYEAGGVDAALRMASYAWRNLGGSSLYASTGEQDENFWQWLMKFPPFNIPGAFVKISDRGVNEEYYEGSDKETREKARKSLDIEKRIKKDVKAHRGIPSREDSDNLYYKLLEAGIILEDESDNEFYRRRYLGYAGKVVDDSRLSLILRARSKADRARALFQAKKNLSPAQYEKLKEKLANLEIEIEEE